METNMPVTTRAYFRTLSILHLALILGQVMFGLIACIMKLTRKALLSFPEETHQALLYLSAGMGLAGIGMSWLLFSGRIKSLRGLSVPADQYTGYRTATLLRYAILEAPSLIALMLFLLTGDYIFLGIAASIVLVFVAIRPTKSLLVKHLQPAYDQQVLLESPDAVLYEDRIPNRN